LDPLNRLIIWPRKRKKRLSPNGIPDECIQRRIIPLLWSHHISNTVHRCHNWHLYVHTATLKGLKPNHLTVHWKPLHKKKRTDSKFSIYQNEKESDLKIRKKKEGKTIIIFPFQ
jgi:hypothetical protein